MKKIIKNPHNNTAGFSLIEVLIALMVLSIGLLGLAALQTAALKTNHGAYYRTQAVFMSYDIIDRMRANRNQAIAGDYNRAITDTDPSTAGLGASMAQIDMDEWYNETLDVLPDKAASITCDGNGVCTVTIEWDETRGDLSANISGTTATQTFTFTTQI